jgi:hypothetical protein
VAGLGGRIVYQASDLIPGSNCCRSGAGQAKKVLNRGAVSSDLDLAIAIGSSADRPLDPLSPAIRWDEKRKPGFFLQEQGPSVSSLRCA